MAPRSDNGSHGLRHAGDDAFQLTVDYLKQETIEPLHGLGRFLYMGIAGSFFLAVGILLILIGILRLLQTETGSALTGDWSWVPYAVVVLLGILVIGIAAWRVTSGPGRQKLPAVVAQRQRAEAQLAKAQLAEAQGAEARRQSEEARLAETQSRATESQASQEGAG